MTIDNLINLIEASFMIWIAYGYWVMHKRVCELEDGNDEGLQYLKPVRQFIKSWIEICKHGLKKLSPSTGADIKIISCDRDLNCPLKEKRKPGRPRKNNK